MKVKPPVPAPYLRGIPHLPDDLLREADGNGRMTLDQERQASRLMRDLKQQLFLARHAYEQREGVQIESEPRIAR